MDTVEQGCALPPAAKDAPGRTEATPPRIRYTCQTKSRTHGDCDGQTGYTVGKLDAVIEAIIHGIFSKVQRLRREDIINACRAGDLEAKKAFIQRLQKDIEKADSELQRLKNEVVKSLMGESAFAPEVLSSVIQAHDQRVQELRKALTSAEREMAEGASREEPMRKQLDALLEWSVAYDQASMSAKKVIVSRIIDRVDVSRNYQLKIKLNISVEQFLAGMGLEVQ